jgi:hypothetical protein
MKIMKSININNGNQCGVAWQYHIIMSKYENENIGKLEISTISEIMAIISGENNISAIIAINERKNIK